MLYRTMRSARGSARRRRRVRASHARRDAHGPSLARAGFAGAPLEAAWRAVRGDARDRVGRRVRRRRLGRRAPARSARRRQDPARAARSARRARAPAPRRPPRATPSSRSCSPPASAARSRRTRSSATRRGARRTPAARCASTPTTQPPSASRPARRSSSPRAATPWSSGRDHGHDAARTRLATERPRPRLPGATRRRTTGVAPNELTATEDRDPFVGTPWHKHVPARVERA